MVRKTKQLAARETDMRKIGQIKLPPRTESIVKVPVTLGSPLVAMTNKCEIQGVVLAAPLTKVVGGYIFFFFFLGPVCISSGSTSAFNSYCATLNF
jgi:hypothetical protein